MFAEFSSIHMLKKSHFIFLLLVPIILELTLSLQGIAYGHAVPDRYSFEPNSLIDTLQTFPDKISILFSERPDPKVSYIHVVDSKGQRIDNDDFKITGQNGREGSISLDKNIVKEGVYSISWLTLSLDDGHVAKGTYVVGVGNLENLENASQNLSQDNNVFSPILGVLKAPVIIGQVSILGFVVLHIFLCNNISKTELRNKVEFLLTPRFTKLVVMFSIMMGIGVTLLPLFQAVVVSGSESSYINNLKLLLFETNNGVVWIVRVICSVTIMCIAYFYGKLISRNVEVKGRDEDHSNGVALLFLILILTCIFIGTNSFVSHSSSLQSWSLLGITTDFIHSVAVSIWIGGLMYVSYVFFPRAASINTIISEKTHQFSSGPKSVTLLILSKFSLLATVTIAIIGITGLSLAWLHIRTADELLISDYGRTLIIKLCIAAPVVFMAVYHQFWIDRMLNFVGIKKTENKKIAETKFGPKKLESIKLTIKIETLLMMLLLCAASLLTVTATPDLRGHENMHVINSEHSSNNAQREFARTLEVQGVPIDLLIHPFHVGFNNFTIRIIGENQNLTETSNIFIEFKKSDLSLGPIIAILERINATSYSTFGGYLSQSGEWDLKITIQRINSYDLNYRLGVTVNSSEIMAEHDSNENSLSGNLDPMHVPSEFTYVAILMSIVFASTSGFFFARGLKRLTIINRYLNIK
jgi:putative copper export protein/methionine-rich copper-binding protein CopC